MRTQRRRLGFCWERRRLAGPDLQKPKHMPDRCAYAGQTPALQARTHAAFNPWMVTSDLTEIWGLIYYALCKQIAAPKNSRLY